MNNSINFLLDEDYTNLEYTYNLELSHAKRGNPRATIFYFDKVLEVEPNHSNALVNKDNILGKLGKYHYAIDCYEFILRLNLINITCLLNKGLALHYLERYQPTISCYDKTLELNPYNVGALYHKACSKALQNKIEQTLSFLEKAIIPDSEYAEKASKDKDFEILNNDSRFKALTP